MNARSCGRCGRLISDHENTCSLCWRWIRARHRLSRWLKAEHERQQVIRAYHAQHP